METCDVHKTVCWNNKLPESDIDTVLVNILLAQASQLHTEYG